MTTEKNTLKFQYHSTGHANGSHYRIVRHLLGESIKASALKIEVVDCAWEEIVKRDEEIASLVEALEFYADQDNWNFNRSHTERNQGNSKHAILGWYTEIIDDTDDVCGMNWIGGKRARAALAAYRAGKEKE